MEDIFNSILRTSLSYILLLALTLFWGKQINSHKNHFNFALSITIGSYIANMGFDTNLKFLPMLFSFLTLSLLYFMFSFISLKNRQLRKWFSGKPTILIEKGKILDENLKKCRFTLDDLSQQLREKYVFDVNEVEYALLEVSGNISILLKPRFKNVTKNDLQLNNNNQKTVLPIEVIMEGKIIEENLTNTYNHEWIKNECKKRMVDLNDVYYLVISTNGQIYYDLFNDNVKT
ncbi:MAG: DUF421 domain-containing protein [Bacillota bacterium]|nr:DUF421 domain-containing protein [Bacillota bacterium]